MTLLTHESPHTRNGRKKTVTLILFVITSLVHFPIFPFSHFPFPPPVLALFPVLAIFFHIDVPSFPQTKTLECLILKKKYYPVIVVHLLPLTHYYYYYYYRMECGPFVLCSSRRLFFFFCFFFVELSGMFQTTNQTTNQITRLPNPCEDRLALRTHDMSTAGALRGS